MGLQDYFVISFISRGKRWGWESLRNSSVTGGKGLAGLGVSRLQGRIMACTEGKAWGTTLIQDKSEHTAELWAAAPVRMLEGPQSLFVASRYGMQRSLVAKGHPLCVALFPFTD